MSYWLGIDVGTTSIAAALCRGEAGQGAQLEVVPLGTRSAVVRSVVYLGQDGEVVVGEAAERRAAADPGRVIREPTRSGGDEVSSLNDPREIGGVSHSAAGVTARVVRWVVDRVRQREGVPAHGIVLTRPASWTAGEIRAMTDALGAVDLPMVRLCSGLEAAAACYSVRERMDVGSTIAVYDLGGGTFEAAVVRKTGAGTFSTLGMPEGIERLGGMDLDEVVFGHVLAHVPTLRELDSEATTAARLRRGFALCRRECTEAKEALSAGTEVTIPVLLPQVQAQVRLSRAEFEDLIRPQVARTVEALGRTLRSAGLGPADLDTVLLVGGSSRVPLVAQLISAALDLPVAVDADPQTAIALGAAVSGLPASAAHPAGIGVADARRVTPVPTTARVAGSDVREPAQTELPPWLNATPPEVDPSSTQWCRTDPRRFPRFAAVGLLGLVLVGGAVAVPFIMTAYRGSTPATPQPAVPAPWAPASPVPLVHEPLRQNPVAQDPAVQDPAAQNPQDPADAVPAIPEPSAGSGGDPRPVHEGSLGATPAQPAKPLGRTDNSPAGTAHGGGRATSRPKPPVSSPPPPPPPPPRHLPDWVETARR